MRQVGRGILVGMLFGLAAAGLTLTQPTAAQDASPAAAPPSAPTTPEDNSAAVLRFLAASEAVDEGIDTTEQEAVMNEISTEDATHEVPGVENVAGNEDEIALFLANAASFSDFSYTMEDTIASGDMVAVHLTLHVEEHNVPGAAPDATADVDAVLITRVACGHIVEFSRVVDSLSRQRQLGLLPAMPAATPTT